MNFFDSHGDAMNPSMKAMKMDDMEMVFGEKAHQNEEKKSGNPFVDCALTLSSGPVEHRWSPYMDNGGTALAVGGQGYVIIAGDTRLSRGFNILSRNSSKISKITDLCMLATGGMHADRLALHRNLQARCLFYGYQNNGAQPSANAVAQLLSTMLYYKRFFPYYALNLLAGIDEKGNGVVYGYDSIGSTEPLTYGCVGSGQALIMPLLDNQIMREHQQIPGGKANLSIEEGVELVKRCFTAAAERDIYTGDGVEMFVITKEGIKKQPIFELRHD